MAPRLLDQLRPSVSDLLEVARGQEVDADEGPLGAVHAEALEQQQILLQTIVVQ